MEAHADNKYIVMSFSKTVVLTQMVFPGFRFRGLASGTNCKRLCSAFSNKDSKSKRNELHNLPYHTRMTFPLN
eukprot:3916745-Amphidinium_carterae.1